jgi:aminoglycoside/choline kinase family phosphotransferase
MNKPAPGQSQNALTGAADARLAALRAWLATELGTEAFSLEPASNDASFRRYFRATPVAGTRLARHDADSLIAMDAPPDKEDCRPFIRIASVFAAAGVNVPTVLAQDLTQGFLLLPDFGNTTFLAALNPETATRLYGDAIHALVAIQKISQPDILPPYDRALLERELMLFPDWYVKVQRDRVLTPAQEKVLRNAFDLLLENNLSQPCVYVHRDYHSRNLMVTAPNPGILDFQDAVYGPITYDLVSLLRDAYIDWEEQRVLDWCIRYWEAARAAGLPIRTDFAEFYRDFEWMGAQRQLKVVGIFARLAHRDGKLGYLNDQPRVMAYLKKTCHRYRELGPLAQLLDDLDPVKQSTGLTF